MKTFPFGMILGLIALGAASQLHARDYLITDFNDTTALSSLRGAIIDANKNGGVNTIHFLSSHRPNSPLSLRLTRGGADEAAALTGDLNILRGNLTLVAPPAGVTIDASGLGDRVFQISSHATVYMENLSITGGTAPGYIYGTLRDGESGGAIWNAGSLTLANCHIAGNASGAGNEPLGNGGGTAAGDGGGIYNAGYLRMLNCTLSDNSSGAGNDGSAGGNGGSLFNAGICSLQNCLVANNRSGNGGVPEGNSEGAGGSGGQGGGIYNTGHLTLLDCSVTNNWAGNGQDGEMPDGDIGAYYQGGWAGQGGDGGGIYNVGTLILQSSLVADNGAGNGGVGGRGNGAPGAAGAGGNGGGIFNANTLKLTGCAIRANACGSGGTGGLCWFATAGDGGLSGSGGGIYNTGIVLVTQSTISWNQTGAGGAGGDARNGYGAGSGNAGGDGGGLFNQGAASINQSAIFSNYCANGGAPGQASGSSPSSATPGDGGNGAGILNLDKLVITNSTISGNVCGDGANGGSGGGIYNGATLQLTACTISGNSFGFATQIFVPPGGGRSRPSNGSGGGIFNFTNSPSSLIRNCLVAGNKPVRSSFSTYYYPAADVSGDFTSQGFNLIGIAAEDSTGFTNGVADDQVGSDAPIDPLLGPLQMNGGPTPTQALLPGSPAIDQGFSFGLHTDQRGQPRPHNFSALPNAPHGDGADIGAFELQ